MAEQSELSGSHHTISTRVWSFRSECQSVLKGGNQRIWINNRSPRSTFCCWKLLQILSPCLSASPHPLLLLTIPRLPAVFPPPEHTLEQFRTIKSWVWASVINPYYLEVMIKAPVFCWDAGICSIILRSDYLLRDMFLNQYVCPHILLFFTNKKTAKRLFLITHRAVDVCYVCILVHIDSTQIPKLCEDDGFTFPSSIRPSCGLNMEPFGSSRINFEIVFHNLWRMLTHRLPATITQRMLITGTPNTVSILKSFPTWHEISAKLLFLTAVSSKASNKFLGKLVVV